jgi:hypothetical protein
MFDFRKYMLNALAEAGLYPKNIIEGIEKLDVLYPNLTNKQKSLLNEPLGSSKNSNKNDNLIAVFEAASVLYLSLSNLSDSLKSLNESDNEIIAFKTKINKVKKDYAEFKKLLQIYNNTPDGLFNYEEVDAYCGNIQNAVGAAHVLLAFAKLKSKQYSDSKVMSMLAEVIGDGSSIRNRVGALEFTNKGIVRELVELSYTLIKTLNKHPINQSKNYKQAKKYIDFVMTEHNWSL